VWKRDRTTSVLSHPVLEGEGWRPQGRYNITSSHRFSISLFFFLSHSSFLIESVLPSQTWTRPLLASSSRISLRLAEKLFITGLAFILDLHNLNTEPDARSININIVFPASTHTDSARIRTEPVSRRSFPESDRNRTHVCFSGQTHRSLKWTYDVSGTLNWCFLKINFRLLNTVRINYAYLITKNYISLRNKVRIKVVMNLKKK